MGEKKIDHNLGREVHMIKAGTKTEFVCGAVWTPALTENEENATRSTDEPQYVSCAECKAGI